MADDIQLGLKLSLKEFFASLQQAGKLTVAEVKKINEMMTQVKSTPLTVDQSKLKESEAAINRLKESYYLLSLGEQDAAEKAMQFIQSQQLSANQTDQLIQSLQNEARTLELNSTEYRAVNNSIQGLILAKQKLAMSTNFSTASNKQLAGSMDQVKTYSQNMNMAIMQGGYALGDAAMIGVNFRFALMGIGNNIPFVIQGLMAAKNEASQMGKTLGQVAMQSIKGPGGILLAVNAVMFAMQVLPGLFDDGTQAIEKQKDAVEELTKEYEKLTRAQIGHYLVDLKKLLQEFEDKYPSKTETQFSLTRVFGGQSPLYKGNVSDEKRFGSDAEEVRGIKEKISLLERELLYKGDIEEADLRIRDNQEKLKNLTKDNFALIVNGAKSYKEAYDTLDKLIKADQNLFKDTKPQKSVLDNLIESTEELTKKLRQVEDQIKKTTDPHDRVLLFKLKFELQNKLGTGTEDIDEINRLINEAALGMGDEQLGNVSTYGPSSIWGTGAGGTNQELKLLAEKNKLLREQKTIWQDMREVVYDAGRTMVSAWTSSFNLIKRNQTMVEQLINTVARAIGEFLTLKAITTIVNFLTAGFGGASGGASAAPSGPAGGGGIFTKSLGSGGSFDYAGAVATRGSLYTGGGSYVKEVPYVVETKAAGRDLKIILKRQNEFDKGYR